MKTFIPNLVSLTWSRLQMLGKIQMDYSGFMNFWSIPYKRKFRTSNDVYLKLGSVNKLDKKTMTISKKLTVMLGQQIMRSSWFFQVMVAYEECRIWIPNAWSIVSIFLKQQKKSLTQLSHYCFAWRCYFCEKCWFFAEKCWHQQNYNILVL